MRLLAIGVAALCIAAPGVARAESGEEMRARGEQLAKDGRFTEAIDAFKAAERIEPRARHACLIALAYTRRELLPQAEIFLEQCEKRATPSDPIPEWVPTAKQQLAERLSTVNVAPVAIRVEPAGIAATLAVSSFAPDERFEPRTIHLPAGRHVILASAAGYRDAQQTVEISDKAPREVVISLVPDATGTPTPPKRPPLPSARPSKLPFVVMGIGGGLVVLGGVVHGTLFRSARSDLEAASTLPDMAPYAEAEKRFDRYRALSIALYAAGAITVGAGVVFELTERKRRAPRIAVGPYADGAMVSVGWTR